jgi:polyisoprenoid-binding protein YceI
MKKTFLFLGIIALTFTLSACTNGEQNSVNESANFSNEQEDGEEISIESGTYNVNVDASSLEWLGERIVGSSHSGSVDIKSGNFIVEDNKISSGEFVLDMTSISDSEGSERLESHLKSEDFFMVNEYPEAKLLINSSNIISSNSNEELVLEVSADLTIKGITNPVDFTTTIKEENDILLANSEFSIDRTKWDIKYDSGNFFQDLGDRAIKDDIYFNINIVTNNK